MDNLYEFNIPINLNTLKIVEVLYWMYAILYLIENVFSMLNHRKNIFYQISDTE